MTKTPGQLAYEEDVRHCPTYPSTDKPRPTWEQIGDAARRSWDDMQRARRLMKATRNTNP